MIRKKLSCWSQQLPSRLMPILLLTTLLVLPGCQEDSRASQTTPQRSAELAASRLDQVTGHISETFGQPKSASKNEQKASGARELTWNAPGTREDGSALRPGQIAGFRIYFRLRHQQAQQVIAIESPTITRYSLDGLPAGAYEFSITTIDVDGRESRPSAPVVADVI